MNEVEANQTTQDQQAARKAQIVADTARRQAAGETPAPSQGAADRMTVRDAETGSTYEVPLSSLGGAAGGSATQLVATIDYPWPEVVVEVSTTNFKLSAVREYATVTISHDPAFGFSFDEYTEDMGINVSGAGMLEIQVGGSLAAVEAETSYDDRGSSLELYAYAGSDVGWGRYYSLMAGNEFSGSTSFGNDGRFYVDNWTTEPGEPTSTHNVMVGFQVKAPQGVALGFQMLQVRIFWTPS